MVFICKSHNTTAFDNMIINLLSIYKMFSYGLPILITHFIHIILLMFLNVNVAYFTTLLTRRKRLGQDMVDPIVCVKLIKNIP